MFCLTHTLFFQQYKKNTEFVPIKLLRLHDFDEWETRLLDHLKDFTSHDNKEKTVQRLYMEDIYKMTIYGSSFFRCNQKGAHNLPENIILGIQFDVRFHLLLLLFLDS